MADAAVADAAPWMEWSDFIRRWRWKQGDHVSLVGPTGQGKSTLGMAILPRRRYVVALGVKPEDDTMDELVAQPGWELLTDWNARGYADNQPRIVLWPRFDSPDDVEHQKEQIGDALADVFTERCWTVYADEVEYVCDQLGQRNTMRLLWKMGRSASLTVVAATQRPAWVPLEFYSQASHCFLWRHNDRRDLDRLGEIAAAGNVDPSTVRRIVSTLPRYVFLYVNTRTGQMVRSKVRI